MLLFSHQVSSTNHHERLRRKMNANAQYNVSVISAVQTFVQDESAVPHNMPACPQWLYSAMPFSLRNRLNRIANGRNQDNSFWDCVCTLAASVPELAAVAHPPRATHEVSAVWAASPPVAMMGAAVGTTWKIGKWTGVISEQSAHTDMDRVKTGKKPAHSAAARLDSLELRTIVDANNAAAEGEDAPMCAICQVEFESEDIGYVFRGCNHPFHVKCMNSWLEKGDTCPCCRKQLQATEKKPCCAQPQPDSPQEAASLQELSSSRRDYEEEHLAFASVEEEDEVASNDVTFKSQDLHLRRASREGEMLMDSAFAAAMTHEPLHAATRDARSMAAAGANILEIEAA